jgi:hypothetical protein
MNNKETLQSYNNKLIQNNNNLQTVIDMINNLPEAGEGGGTLNVKTYLIKDGIEQVDVTGGHQLTEGSGTYAEIQGEGYIDILTKQWADVHWVPNNTFDFTKYTKICIELEYPNQPPIELTNGGVILRLTNAAIEHVALQSKNQKPRFLATWEPGSQFTDDLFKIYVANMSPSSDDYANYPVRIYNVWFEYQENIANISEELTDYDTKLTVQEDQLLVIAETLKNKAAGANINIFVQEDEPEKKEGLWIKTSQTKPNNISINKLGLKLEWAWEKWTTPVNNAYNRVVKYENYLYSFCGRDSNNNLTNSTFKFNLNTNTAESITPYPINTSASAIGIVNDKIYLFGGATKIATSYVYDIKTDTYTPIKDLPVGTQQAGFVTIGTDVYIFGGASTTSGNSTEVYKYDTLTDTYTKMAGMPVGYCTHCCIYKDGFVYIFGGLKSGGYNQTSFKYNVANNTYTTIKSFPVNRGHYAAGIIGDDIYVFGGYYGGGTYIYDVYKYNTTTDTYTKMPNMSNTWFNGGYVSDGNIVYLVNGEHLGESNDLNVISKYGYINKKEFVNDTIVISTDEDLYNANILNNVNTYFNDVLLYSVAENVYQTNLPAYYGDGEKWISLRGEE